MHNLCDIRHLITRLPYKNSQNITATWDASNNSCYYACDPSFSDREVRLYQFDHEVDKSKQFQLVAAWDAQQNDGSNSSLEKIISLHYFPDELSFCVVFSKGDICIVRKGATDEQNRVEIIGSIDSEIAAASWAPDDDLLTIVAAKGTLSFLSRTYDLIREVRLEADDLKNSSHVSVGWGTAETQFKGRKSKGLRDPTVPETVDIGRLSPYDDGSVKICWRGDGAYVAINSIEEAGRRSIRIYTRDGQLHSVSEPVDGLEGALSWRPIGNIIAGIQRQVESAAVVFFERNGLRHGHFNLRLNAEELRTWGSDIGIEWNSDSSALAVQYKDRVQIWTMDNYHYYLKKEIKNIEYNEDHFFSMNWHPEKPLLLSKSYNGKIKVFAKSSYVSDAT